MPTPAPLVSTGDVLTATNFNYLPRGIIGVATKTADQTGISSVADVTSLTLTWTATSSRYYRTTVFFNAQQNASIGTPQIYITDGSGTVKTKVLSVQNTGDYWSSVVTLVETGLSGSTTRKVQALTNAGTLSILGNSTYPSLILIEDIGAA